MEPFPQVLEQQPDINMHTHTHAHTCKCAHKMNLDTDLIPFKELTQNGS